MRSQALQVFSGGGGSFTARRQGFTLAEVLITLGIIGVIAAMVLPTLIQKYQKLVVETQLKVAYSLITNAFKFAEAENGIGFDFLPNSWKDDEELADVNGYSYEFSEAAFESYLRKYFKVIRSYSKSDSVSKFKYNNNIGISGHPKCYLLANGMGLCFIASGNINSTAYFYIFLKPDNKNKIAGKDVFNFTVRKKGRGTYYGYQMMSDVYNESRRQEYLEGCANKTSTHPVDIYDAPFICTMLIWNNNLKIPDDYPISF